MKQLIMAAFLALAWSQAAPADTRGKPDEEALARAARLNAQLAVAYLKQNDVNAAREKIEKALAENPHDSGVQGAAGLVYTRMQELDKAEGHWSAALRLAPDDAEVQNNSAVFLCQRGKTDKGLKLFEQAARNASYATPEVAYANAGVCARNGKNPAKAEDLFRKALSIRADYPDALLQMADLSLAKDAALAARAFLDRYFAVAPVTPESLLLGIRIAHKTGDRATEDKYSDRLEHDFADSDQARRLREGAGQR